MQISTCTFEVRVNVEAKTITFHGNPLEQNNTALRMIEHRINLLRDEKEVEVRLDENFVPVGEWQKEVQKVLQAKPFHMVTSDDRLRPIIEPLKPMAQAA